MSNIISFEKLGLSFTVNRTAFSIFGIDIYWYGIIIAIGLVCALIYATNATKREGIDQNDFLNMFIITVPCAIIGARIYYVIFNFSDYKNSLVNIFNIRQGGLAVYGGIIVSLLVIYIYSRIKNIKYSKSLDILAVGLLIGQSVGRWGNFINAEAFGTQTDSLFAMTIVNNGVTIASNVHPTFLYESLWNAFGIAVLLLYKKKQPC